MRLFKIRMAMATAAAAAGRRIARCRGGAKGAQRVDPRDHARVSKGQGKAQCFGSRGSKEDGGKLQPDWR